MHLTTHVKRWLLVAAFFTPLTVGRTQGTPPEAGWNARMTSLQEEQDAQAGVAVSIVFDDSGSMDDNHKLAMAKKAFRTWIEHAPDSYRFGLVALNAGQLVPLQRNDRAQILTAVDHLRAGGGTPLAQTIARVAKGISARRAGGSVYERQVVVVLTDGEDTSNRGIKGVQEEIRRLCANRVEVIAFGYQGEGDYMRESATHFYSPENEQDIGKGLNAIGSEIGDTSDVVVDDATRSLMRNIAVSVPVQATSTPTPTTTPAEPFSPYRATPPPQPTATPPTHHARGSGTGMRWLALIAIFVVIRSLRRRR